jgi:nucleoside-diphosphate-sugar epimerase
MKLVITGISGYIGEHLAKLALNRGHIVVAASRCPPTSSAFTWLHYDLRDKQSVTLPTGINVVLHLAANTSSVSEIDGENEVLAARVLLVAARKAGAKFLFVSSQTARYDAPSVYGNTKWRIEKEVLSAGGWVVRPGQVYGGSERGLFGMLVGAVRRFLLLPAFLPVPMVQPIYIDDLVEGLLRIVERDLPSGITCLASPEAVSFTHFLSTIAKCRVRHRRWFLPVPVVLTRLAGLMLGSRLKALAGINRLNSLFELPLMDTVADLNQLELSLRSLPDGMHPSGRIKRRRLLREGHALLSYLLKKPPTSSLLRRYVRAVQSLRGGLPLNLPELFLIVPNFLALLDGFVFAPTQQGVEFFWRLDSATVLAEATPDGANHFLGVGRNSGILASFLWMCNAVIGEIFWRILRAASFPILQRLLLRTGASSDP